MQAKQQQQLRLVKTIRTAMGNLTVGRFPALTTLHKYIAVIVYFFEREHDLLPATGVMVPPRGTLHSYSRDSAACFQRFSDIYWQWNDGLIAELKTAESVIIRDEMVGCSRNNLVASAGKLFSDDIQLLICEYLDIGFLEHPIERVVKRVVSVDTTTRVIRCFANLERESLMEIARVKMDHLLEPALFCLDTKTLADIMTKSKFYGIIAKQFSPDMIVRDRTTGRLPPKPSLHLDKRRVIMEAIIGAMNFCPTVRTVNPNSLFATGHVAIELGPCTKGGPHLVAYTEAAVSRDMVRQKLGNIAIYIIDYILELASRKVHAIELPFIAKRDAKLRKEEKKKRGKRPAEEEEHAGAGGAGGGGEPVKRRRAPATGTVPGRRRRRVLVEGVEEVAEGAGAGGGVAAVAVAVVVVVVDLTADDA